MRKEPAQKPENYSLNWQAIHLNFFLNSVKKSRRSIAVQKTPPVAEPLQIFKYSLIHATASPHARNCQRAKYRLTNPEKTELFRRNKVRWQENMRCAELVEARCQGVACAKPAWRQGSTYIFLNFFVLFVLKQKVQKTTYN
ncbi:MAG TPA: hypothetical protein PKN48_15650 [Bacteroidales bacterium]|nr:hypothetical protein [Bacteroidales bacterium]